MRIKTLKKVFNNLPTTEEIKPKELPVSSGKGLLTRYMGNKEQKAEAKKEDARQRVARYVREIQEERRKLKDGR